MEFKGAFWMCIVGTEWGAVWPPEDMGLSVSTTASFKGKRITFDLHQVGCDKKYFQLEGNKRVTLQNLKK